jgi:hypothetical protein
LAADSPPKPPPMMTTRGLECCVSLMILRSIPATPQRCFTEQRSDANAVHAESRVARHSGKRSGQLIK